MKEMFNLWTQEKERKKERKQESKKARKQESKKEKKERCQQTITENEKSKKELQFFPCPEHLAHGLTLFFLAFFLLHYTSI